ncbi:cysteine hydrolase family protein [Anaeromicropila herbilytica]|uniref:Isochorismatase n=1 Tax=Anaeromicropila herbilytica TaxID=2785025 RepID=A0A7R7EMM0_9FIRM|nr:cysteine hydrolase family protein [Anaeromicropila herbilytica]BCN31661.1 isochorismatase [Anaeromicropila herbilytica]
MKRVLILIDIQNVYFEEGNYLLYQPQRAVEKAFEALEVFRGNNEPVIHVGHMFYKEDQSESACHSREFYHRVQPQDGEYVIWKEKPSSFLNTQLAEMLEKLEAQQIVIGGMMSHMCVDTTVRACQDYGYPVILLEDACTTKALSFQGDVIEAEVVHKAFMASLNGMFADVMTVDEWKAMPKEIRES